MKELDQENFTYSQEMITSDDTEIFHSKNFSCMKNWAFIHQIAFCAIMWIDAIEKGLHQFSTWNDIKILLEIDDPKEYFYSIGDCGEVTIQFQFTVDFMANKFTYVDYSSSSRCYFKCLESRSWTAL
jgi:hypothetical protein